MVKIFICEFITGGGLQPCELPMSLVREGDIMLQAVIDDCLQTEIYDISITRDIRLPPIDRNIKIIDAGPDIWNQWKNCINNSDYVLIIAPETHSALLNLTKMVEAGPAINLGCRSKAIEITGSKIQTFRKLLPSGLKIIPTFNIEDIEFKSIESWIIKPDDGAGAENLRLFHTKGELINAIKILENSHTYIIQPYIKGIHASMTIMCCDGEAVVLSCNKQLFEFVNNTGKLKGLIVNGINNYLDEFAKIAEKIITTTPGLWGIIGIDMIITDDGPVVVEINPRITTSYAVLRKSIGHNPMKWLFDLYNYGHLPVIDRTMVKPEEILLHS